MIDYRMDAAAVALRVAHAVHGIVSAVDPVNHAVKVKVQPDNVETGWIADACGVSAGDLRISRPSCVGTHVILLPSEGDAEHLSLVGVVFDTVVVPPVSPQTGEVAQPGEMLVKAGCGVPPVANGDSVGNATRSAPWWHMTPQGLYLGAGSSKISISENGISCVVGGVTLILSASGMALEGGGIRSDGDVSGAGISLTSHVHTNGNDGGNTGEPVS